MIASPQLSLSKSLDLQRHRPCPPKVLHPAWGMSHRHGYHVTRAQWTPAKSVGIQKIPGENHLLGIAASRAGLCPHSQGPCTLPLLTPATWLWPMLAGTPSKAPRPASEPLCPQRCPFPSLAIVSQALLPPTPTISFPESPSPQVDVHTCLSLPTVLAQAVVTNMAPTHFQVLFEQALTGQKLVVGLPGPLASFLRRSRLPLLGAQPKLLPPAL